MGMSDLYGSADETESIATIHAALDAGVTLLDTGDYYAAGHNELLIGRALRDRRDKALLSVKFGALRGPDGSWLGIDTRPAAVKNFVAYSLRRLGVDHIDIYRPGRLDPNVPIEETVGAIADLVKAGYVRAIGLSEVGPDTIRRGRRPCTRQDLQIEYSLISRGPETRIFPLLEELGIGVTAYGVLSRGLLTGSRPAGWATSARTCPALRAENRAAKRAVRRGAPGTRRGQGIAPLAARHRMGAREAQGHRPRHRCAHAESNSPTRSALSRCSCRPRSSIRSRRSFPRRPWPELATARIRCESSTASA